MVGSPLHYAEASRSSSGGQCSPSEPSRQTNKGSDHEGAEYGRRRCGFRRGRGHCIITQLGEVNTINTIVVASHTVNIDGRPFKARSYRSFIFYLYCLLISSAFLLICTKSSPLYPLNDWQDANAFFTMGKGMMNGKVLYRDLFEQKGPLLYFLHGLAYLISNTSFLGVYLLEVIAVSFFLFFSHKMIALYLDTKYSTIALPLIAAVVLNMRSFAHGDSAEELSMPIIAYSLYCLLRYFTRRYPEAIGYKTVLLNGIITGCVLWIKFSLLGFWFGWIAAVFLCALKQKRFGLGLKEALAFLGGMSLLTIPWIIYFGVHHSIGVWLHSYFYINIFYYPSDLTLLGRVKTILIASLYNSGKSIIFGSLLLIGLVAFLIASGFIRSAFHRATLLLCVIFLILGIYGGGRGYVYYFLIFAPFGVLGMIALLFFVKKRLDGAITRKTAVVCAAVALLISLPLSARFNHNTYMLGMDKRELMQYQFAELINQTEGATLLNYGDLDYGVFTTANIVPNIRFFEGQNIEYERFPLVRDEQNRYIREKEVDYVVLEIPAEKTADELSVPYLYENYDLIATSSQIYEELKLTYLLFQRNELTR